MATQELSDRTVLITLPAEPQLSNDLDLATRAAEAGADLDVLLDFSLVEIMPSATICSLIILKRLLDATDHHLILHSVPSNIMDMLQRLGLWSLFQFAEDRSTAVRMVASLESRRT